MKLSHLAAPIALALAAECATVRIMDADIYGPSQPRMLGVSGRPSTPDGKNTININEVTSTAVFTRLYAR